MIRDLNTKKTMKNAYRITKNKYKTSLRVRIPGGCVDPESLMIVSKIASEYGNGDIHITTRQGFEILGIKMEDMGEVNKLIQPVIEKMDINQGEKNSGYPAAGTRNICACIGNKVCPKAQYNTTEFAKKIEKAVFPNDLHFKIALTGCPNDNIVQMAKWLSDHGKDMWIRHVLVPDLTDDEERLVRTRDLIRELKTVKRVEVLPYHTLGLFKWQKLGIPYTLDGVRTPTAEEVKKAEEILEVSQYK